MYAIIPPIFPNFFSNFMYRYITKNINNVIQIDLASIINARRSIPTDMAAHLTLSPKTSGLLSKHLGILNFFMSVSILYYFLDFNNDFNPDIPDDIFLYDDTAPPEYGLPKGLPPLIKNSHNLGILKNINMDEI